MADNTLLSAAVGVGDTIASDDIAGIKHQRIKVQGGVDGAATDIGVAGGTEATALRVTIATDSTGVLSIDDNGGSITVDGTVTANPASGTITTVSTVTALTTLTGGGVAHDGADAGNPIKTGARATTADITAVAAADRTDTLSDTIGYGLVRPYALHENLTQGATAAITGTASTEVIAAGAAGVRNYITSLTVINSHATVSTVVEIRDGAATVIHRGYALAAGGGYVVTFPTPLRGTAATAINAFAITTGSNVYVSGSGYRAAV